jgi:hypothetical protein
MVKTFNLPETCQKEVEWRLVHWPACQLECILCKGSKGACNSDIPEQSENTILEKLQSEAANKDRLIENITILLNDFFNRIPTHTYNWTAIG